MVVPSRPRYVNNQMAPSMWALEDWANNSRVKKRHSLLWKCWIDGKCLSRKMKWIFREHQFEILTMSWRHAALGCWFLITAFPVFPIQALSKLSHIPQRRKSLNHCRSRSSSNTIRIWLFLGWWWWWWWWCTMMINDVQQVSIMCHIRSEISKHVEFGTKRFCHLSTFPWDLDLGRP